MQSIWEKEVAMPTFAPLEADKKVDVLIIGGGIAGILCAHFLEDCGVEYCLAEANRITEGITGHTTAKVTAQHGFIYHKLAERYGLEAARQYYTANQNAIERFGELCKEIDCNWERKDNYVYSVKNRKKAEREMKTLEQIGANARFEENVPLPFATCGAICFPDQAQFHPLKFLAEISKGLCIYEKTKVTGFGGGTGEGEQIVFTNRGRIAAKKVIVATHFPMLNKHGSYFVKLYQHRSYVLTLKDAVHLLGMYVDEDKKGFSFRNEGDYLLFGGGGHRTGKKGGSYTGLRCAAKVYYPGAKEVCRFAAQDCMSLDGIPYIGTYAKHCDNVFVATGFNKWGMTSSMVAAKLLSDLVQGKKSEYEQLFSPSRSMVTGQLALNVFEATASLLSFSKLNLI